MTLTGKQIRALTFADRNGAVFAGRNVSGHGSFCAVSYFTIRALVQRGLLSEQTSPDGKVMARLTERGQNVLTLAGMVES